MKTRFYDPYRKDGNKVKTNLPNLKVSTNASGVYFIKDKETGEIVYIGYSKSSLYKTIYRHFQEWTDSSRRRKKRFTYPKFGYSVRIIYTTTERAWLLEKYLILKMKPRDNNLKYETYLSEEQQANVEETLGDCKEAPRKDFFEWLKHYQQQNSNAF